MRRAGALWPRVVDFDALCTSARRASLGKRRNVSVARFLADLEPRALALQGQLDAGTWRPGAVTRFRIHDPKPRTISVAPFRDRVVHHALMGALEPVLDRAMVHESFACRRGKGTHAALDHAQGLVRRWGWFVKLDVARCFDSVRHDLVLGRLERRVKDRRVLGLCASILEGPPSDLDADPTTPRRGLPIGSLTSQWFCNLLLDRLDHHVKECLRVRGYVRYMDDFVLFAATKAEARQLRGAVEGFLVEELDLRPNPRSGQLGPTRAGLPFLGWRLYPRLRRVRPGNLARLRDRLRRRAWEVRRGTIDEATYREGLASILEHLRHGSTLELRRSWLGRLPQPHRGRSP